MELNHKLKTMKDFIIGFGKPILGFVMVFIGIIPVLFTGSFFLTTQTKEEWFQMMIELPHSSFILIIAITSLLSITCGVIGVHYLISSTRVESHGQKTVELCNCDMRDMACYEEDGKIWCPQCGLEVK